MFCHSPETWKQLWIDIFTAIGGAKFVQAHVRVEAELVVRIFLASYSYSAAFASQQTVGASDADEMAFFFVRLSDTKERDRALCGKAKAYDVECTDSMNEGVLVRVYDFYDSIIPSNVRVLCSAASHRNNK